jgi:hypothetical protein
MYEITLSLNEWLPRATTGNTQTGICEVISASHHNNTGCDPIVAEISKSFSPSMGVAFA